MKQQSKKPKRMPRPQQDSFADAYCSFDFTNCAACNFDFFGNKAFNPI